jgi:hypothetical protein
MGEVCLVLFFLLPLFCFRLYNSVELSGDGLHKLQIDEL